MPKHRTLSRLWFTVAAILIGASAPCHPAAAQNACQGRWVVPPEAELPGVDGTVRALTRWDPDGDGPLAERVLVGGIFQIAGAVQAANIATWDGQQWQRLGDGIAGAGNEVNSLCVFNGQPVAGGSFTSIGSLTVHHISRWDGTAWRALGNGLSNRVQALAVWNGQLIAGGVFTASGSTQIAHVAKWNGSTWEQMGAGLNDYVYALTVYNGELYAGGSFTASGAAPVAGIARWNGVGQAWVPVGDAVSAGVSALRIYQNKLAVAGGFTVAGQSPTPKLALWDGTSWSYIGGLQANRYIRALAVDGPTLTAGGYDFTAPSTYTPWVQSWNGSAWQELTQGVSGRASFSGTPAVYAIETLGENTIVGGDYRSAGGKQVLALAAWRQNAWHTVGLGFDSDVSRMCVHGDELFVTGNFNTVGDTATGRAARWDGTVWRPATTPGVVIINPQSVDGRLVGVTATGTNAVDSVYAAAEWDGAAWRPIGGPTTGIASSITVYQGQPVMAGIFTAIDGAPISGIARWTGTAWEQMGDGLQGGVQNLLVADGELIAAGSFTTSGAAGVLHVARWTGSNWQQMGDGVSGTPRVLTTYGGKVTLAGGFNQSGAVSVGPFVQWNGSAWQPAPFFTRGLIYALADYRGDLYAAGETGTPPQSLVRSTGSAWELIPGGLGRVNTLTGWASIYALQEWRGSLYVAGNFATANGVTAAYFVRYERNSADCGSAGGVSASDGALDNNDFIVFITRFFANDPRADLGRAAGLEGGDGVWDNNDFVAFISLFFNGCN